MGIWDIIKQNERAESGVDTHTINTSAREFVNRWKRVLLEEGSQEHVKEAGKYFDKASQCYDSQVLIELAEIYSEGYLVPQNMEKACSCAIRAFEVSENKARDKYILDVVFGEMIMERTLGDCLISLKDSMDAQTREYLNMVEENYWKSQLPLEYKKQEECFGKKIYNGAIPWDELLIDFTYGKGELKPNYMAVMYCLMRLLAKDEPLTTMVKMPRKMSALVQREYNRAYDIYKKGADFREAAKMMEIPARKGHLDAIHYMEKMSYILEGMGKRSAKTPLSNLWPDVEMQVINPIKNTKEVFSMIMQAANGDTYLLHGLIVIMSGEIKIDTDRSVQADESIIQALRSWELGIYKAKAEKGDGLAIEELIKIYRYRFRDEDTANYWRKRAVDMGYVPVMNDYITRYIVNRSSGKPVPINEFEYLRYVSAKERAGYADVEQDRQVLKTMEERERWQEQIYQNNMAKKYESEMAKYREKLDDREVFANIIFNNEALTNEERGYVGYLIKDEDRMRDAIHDYMRRSIKEKDYLEKLKRRDGDE